ncbi:hypothetical protein BDW75DRAFT_206459 [Aspergillus navahoensis]
MWLSLALTPSVLVLILIPYVHNFSLYSMGQRRQVSTISIVIGKQRPSTCLLDIHLNPLRNT